MGEFQTQTDTPNNKNPKNQKNTWHSVWYHNKKKTKILKYLKIKYNKISDNSIFKRYDIV